jgi:hypothetical protein
MTESDKLLKLAAQDNTHSYLTQGSCCLGRPFFNYIDKVINIGKRIPFQMHHLSKLDDHLVFETNFTRFKVWRAEQLAKNPNMG